jgi:hypothetical protein
MDVRLARNPEPCYNSTSLPDSRAVRWVRRPLTAYPLGGVVLLFIWQRPLYHMLKRLPSFMFENRRKSNPCGCSFLLVENWGWVWYNSSSERCYRVLVVQVAGESYKSLHTCLRRLILCNTSPIGYCTMTYRLELLANLVICEGATGNV